MSVSEMDDAGGDAANPTGPCTANNMASPCRTVFLDLDEVLCIGQAEACLNLSLAFGRGEMPSSQELASLFSPAARNALVMAHRRSEGAKYVISSTWREHLSREQMVMVLVGGGLQFVAENLHVGDAWRCVPKRVYRERRAEILHWLNTHHQGEPFVVLDDLNSADLRIPLIADTHSRLIADSVPGDRGHPEWGA